MDRDRLIELCENLILSCKSSLCNDCEHNKIDYPHCMSVHFADYLLANGVIAPPCKVGDFVYVIEDWGYKKILKEKEVGVIAIKGTNDFSVVMWEDVYGGEIGKLSDIGKTVFLTKEEAEEKLKECKGK